MLSEYSKKNRDLLVGDINANQLVSRKIRPRLPRPSPEPATARHATSPRLPSPRACPRPRRRLA